MEELLVHSFLYSKQDDRCQSILWNLIPTTINNKHWIKSKYFALQGRLLVSKKLSAEQSFAELTTECLRKLFNWNDSSFKRRQVFGQKQYYETIKLSIAGSFSEKTIELPVKRTTFNVENSSSPTWTVFQKTLCDSLLTSDSWSGFVNKSFIYYCMSPKKQKTLHARKVFGSFTKKWKNFHIWKSDLSITLEERIPIQGRYDSENIV